METDIVLEGLQFTGIKTEISGVTYCAHQKLRGAIQACLMWIEHNNPDSFPSEKNEDTETDNAKTPASEDNVEKPVSKPKKSTK
ncbi:hypothetical protein ACKI1K_45115, partial [Streptomyces scabiei]|uniref:hypothetical protein n=1 Tax=Streptomyces scabiei TaxID=1930 RepID=UPI0038F60130